MAIIIPEKCIDVYIRVIVSANLVIFSIIANELNEIDADI